jgi:hypothetical protein
VDDDGYVDVGRTQAGAATERIETGSGDRTTRTPSVEGINLQEHHRRPDGGRITGASGVDDTTDDDRDETKRRRRGRIDGVGD